MNPILDRMSKKTDNMPKINQQQIQMAKAFLDGKGMTAEQAVRMICQQRGIDVNQLVNQFK